jgi:hypothetical protein
MNLQKAKANKTAYLIFIYCFYSALATAQTDNYWSWSFNTPSTLLGGAVVGGSAGPSAVYYNPSLIGQENIASLSLSASIISLQFLKVENLAGENINGEDFIFKIQPRFLSYVIPTKNEKWGVEAVVLSPTSDEKEYVLQHESEIDIIQRVEGLEKYVGYLRYNRRFDDTWVGAGFSYKINPQFFIGSSAFVSTKILNYQFIQNAKAYQKSDTIIVNGQSEPKYIAESGFEEEVKYWDVSFVIKLGAQYKSKNEQFSIGANVTFPNIPFLGTADVRKSGIRSNVFNNQSDQFTSNQSFAEVERDIKTLVKSPFSIALGMQYVTVSRKNSILFTVEYFHSLDTYNSININSNVDSEILGDIPVSSTDFMSYYAGAKPVTNFAIGFKQYFNEKLFVLGGFRTDFSASSTSAFRFLEDKFKINQVHLDKYHITLGPVARFKNIQVITGLQYTYGRNRGFENIVNYANPVEYIPSTNQSLQGLRQGNAEAYINELALFFGLTLGLKK